MSKQLKTVLSLTAEKKHSVRYDTKDPESCVRTLYVTKSALGAKPFPQMIKLVVETSDG